MLVSFCISESSFHISASSFRVSHDLYLFVFICYSFRFFSAHSYRAVLTEKPSLSHCLQSDKNRALYKAINQYIHETELIFSLILKNNVLCLSFVFVCGCTIPDKQHSDKPTLSGGTMKKPPTSKSVCFSHG